MSNLRGQSADELHNQIIEAIDELASRADPAAFATLLSLSQRLGQALGDSARTLAEYGSWSRVASVAGTTRQAAWQRWNEPHS